MAAELDDQTRQMIVRGLSHDYKRALAQVLRTADDLAQALPPTDEIETLSWHASYKEHCLEIANFLDHLCNRIYNRQSERLGNIFPEQLASAIRGMEHETAKLYRLACGQDSTIKILIERLTGQTQRAHRQLRQMWSMPFNDYASAPQSIRISQQLRPIWQNVSFLLRIHDSSKGLFVIYGADNVLTVNLTLFQIAIQNILANAIMHSRKGADLKIVATAQLECVQNLDEEDGHDCLVLTIKDNGPGIPIDEAERIFVLFYQGQHAASAFEGTGVGLTFARLAMKMLGGSLALNPGDGSGASFALRFPLKYDCASNKMRLSQRL